MTLARISTILFTTIAMIVAVLAFLFIPLALRAGHFLDLPACLAVLVVSVWYIARVMRRDRKERIAEEAALPEALRPTRREPRRPVTFQVKETGVAFVIWYAIALAFGSMGMGLEPAVNLGVAFFAAFMLATLTVTGRHMMFRLTGPDDDA